MSDRSQLRLGVIADIHLAPAGTRATSWHGPIHGAQMRSRLGEALACLEDEAVGAVVLLGDLTEGADRESANSVLLDCAGLRRPTFVVPGNCDLGADGSMLAGACESAGSPVELLSSRGTLLGGGLRIAGQPLAHVAGEVRASALPDTASWNGDAAIWISHYPPLSRATKTAYAPAFAPADGRWSYRSRTWRPESMERSHPVSQR